MDIWMLDPGAMTIYYDVALARALHRQGVPIYLLTSPFPYEADVPEADVFAEPFFFRGLAKGRTGLYRRVWLRRIARTLVYPLDLLRLWQRFQQEPPDILHVQWTLLPALDRRALARMANRVPLVLTVHDPRPNEQALTWLSAMEPVYQLAHRLIVHTEANRRTLLEQSSTLPERIRVIPHGPLFEEQPAPDRLEARARLSLSPDALIILFFGIIKPYKGLMDLIEAFAQVQESMPGARLLVAGRVQGSAAPYLEAVSARSLQQVVDLHLSFIPSEQVGTYFAAADVVCLPYREASQSGVLLSAYRFGKPVVVTNVGGLPDTVEAGHNGLIVPPADPPALASAIIEMLSNPARLERFGRHSWHLAETRYNWDRAAELTRQVYNELL